MEPETRRGRMMFPNPQQITLNRYIAPPVGDSTKHQTSSVFPVVLTDLNRINVSKALLNIDKPGPVITNASLVYYNDRYEQNKKWYFPCFSLLQPLQDSFQFTAWMSGVNGDASPAYSGEVSFVIKKTIPAEVMTAVQNGSGVSFNEIPLTNTSFSFSVTTADKQGKTFPCSLVQKDDTVTLTARLDQQDGLILFYKFISDIVNKPFCSIDIKATCFAYTPKPSSAPVSPPLETVRTIPSAAVAGRTILMGGRQTISPFIMNRQVPSDQFIQKDEYTANDAMAFTASIRNVCFDCHEFSSNYCVKNADGSASPFGCMPPFSHDHLSKNDYTEVHILHGSLEGTGIGSVYRNNYSGSYLLIPETYCIGLDESEGDLLIPAAYLFTTVDANNINSSTATFRFNITPNVSGFQLLKLKKLLLQNLPGQLQRKPDDIHTEFPSAIWQPETIRFNKQQTPCIDITCIGSYTHGVEGSNLFRLEFQNVSIGDGSAATIATGLKCVGGEMIEAIAFEVDSDTNPNPQSSIVLSLNNFSGKGLEIQQNGEGKVCLINKTLLDIPLSAIADKDDEPKRLNPPVLIPNNNTVETAMITDAADVASAEFEYAYELNKEYTGRILKEIRTDAGQVVKDTILITNNTGLFTLYPDNPIEKIVFTVSIISSDDPDPSHALFATQTELMVDGKITFIDFFLPVANYLGKWSVIYATTICFRDKSVQTNDPRRIDDINTTGKLINLTVSRLNLSRKSDI